MPGASRGEVDRLRTEARLQAGSSSPRNLDYAYCGTPSLKPMSAYDDGVHTRLRFADKAEFPAIFVRNDDKQRVAR